MGKPIVGVLGGGQLGRMLCEAANLLDIQVAVLDEDLSPAKQVHHKPDLHVVGSFKDPDKIRELASRCDVLTVEIEHVDTEVLEEIETKGVEVALPGGKTALKKVPVHPSWRTIRLIQDKYAQKEHFRRYGPVAEQVAIDAADVAASLDQAARRFGYPFMVKARKGSYDGRGNFKVRAPEELRTAADKLGKTALYAERWVPFEMELAVMVVRTEDGEGNLKGLYTYPAVETVHDDNICTKVFMPPRRVSAAVCDLARRTAADIVASLWGRGVFAVEMFLLRDGTILVNEVAPRPHNSGHYTIEALPAWSQYRAQLYAILDMVPADLELTPRVPAAIMLNVLGGADATSHDRLVALAERTYRRDVDVFVHMYGKAARPERKIGHVTLTSARAGIAQLERDAAELLACVDDLRAERYARLGLPAPSAAAPATSSKKGGSNDGVATAAKPLPLVAVTMGSDSDLPVLRAGLDVLELFEVPYEVRITSAHRTPKLMMEFARDAAGRGVKVIIAGAGGAAHLPGMLASETTLPVVGVPVKATHLDGMDSLLSIVQMPRGVPVATVGINNSTNAALLAIRILGSFYPEYQARMEKYMTDMEEGVHTKSKKLEAAGYKAYLEEKDKK